MTREKKPTDIGMTRFTIRWILFGLLILGLTVGPIIWFWLIPAWQHDGFNSGGVGNALFWIVPGLAVALWVGPREWWRRYRLRRYRHSEFRE